MSPLDLSDFNSPTWAKLKIELQQRIDDLRLRNDSLSLPEPKTIAIRARIAELKNLLTLDNPAPAIEADEP